jgi:hypothetical protein
LVVLTLLLLLFVMAPTPGDIGGCGQEAKLLDAPVFFATKKSIDCRRCADCGLYFDTCALACEPFAPTAQAFPEGCFPLVHDGEVCLRAMNNASCGDYGDFVTDELAKRQTPTECNFCPVPPP